MGISTETLDPKRELTVEEAKLIQDMEKYEIRTFGDFIRVLLSKPEWLEFLRSIILTHELIELPRVFQEFLEKEFRPLKEDVSSLKNDVRVLKEDVRELKEKVDKLEKDVDKLKQDVNILKQDVKILKKDMAYIKGEFGRFKGSDFERKICERYYAYFGRALKKLKKIQMEEILPLLDEAEEAGLITEDEADEIRRLDLILQGVMKSTGKKVVLAVEVSYSLYGDDLERALRRANFLAALLKEEVIPTLICVEAQEELIKEADEKGIYLLKTSY